MEAVPFFNLSRQTTALKAEILSAIELVVDASAFASGPFVRQFEEKFATFCEAKHCLAVSNGTDALLFALLALGIRPGDEVITVPNTFIATVEAITQIGAKPIFVDVHPDTYNMDADLVEEKITKKTKAILPVHLYGQPCNLEPLLQLAQSHSLALIEDACQAHGARYKGKRIGSWGDVGCFSFYPGKNLGAFGEAGALVTNNDSLVETVIKLREHGQRKKYYHDIPGFNGRCDGIQGAVLNVKLPYLEKWNKKRREIAKFYSESLRHHSRITLPIEAENVESAFHLYVVRVSDRDSLITHLNRHQIGWGLHYPVPLHLTEAYAHLGFQKGAFPITERYAEEVISLPMFPELTTEEMVRVTEVLKQF